MLNGFLADESATCRFGAQLAAVCPSHCVIYLQGELGAGKTTVARGFLRALGYSSIVKSPTYTLIESYDLATRQVLHLDLYRLSQPIELEDMGIRDYLSQSTTWLVEWPDRGLGLLPTPDLVCCLQSIGEGRQLRLWATEPKGYSIMVQLRTHGVLF